MTAARKETQWVRYRRERGLFSGGQQRRLWRFELRPEGEQEPAKQGLSQSSEVTEDFAS